MFRQLVSARIVEPTSKADSLRVLGEACPLAPARQIALEVVARRDGLVVDAHLYVSLPGWHTDAAGDESLPAWHLDTSCSPSARH